MFTLTVVKVNGPGRTGGPWRSRIDARRALCLGGGDASPMITRHDSVPYALALPGIERRTLCHGERMLMTEFRLKGGSVLPAHAHPHEQTGYLVSGRLRLRIGAEERELAPGDSWSIPGGVEHQAAILEDAVALEVFSPVREDYLPRGE